MHKRTKAVAIKKEVREAVERRDGGCCIFCGHKGKGEAHYIGRAQGGLGIEENIVTACRICHGEMDNGKNTKAYKEEAREYLMQHYPDWDEKKLIYSKW